MTDKHSSKEEIDSARSLLAWINFSLVKNKFTPFVMNHDVMSQEFMFLVPIMFILTKISCYVWEHRTETQNSVL